MQTIKKIKVVLAGLIAASIFAVSPATATNTAPVINNIQVAQRENSFLVDISYDLFDAESDTVSVQMYFSPDGGTNWPVRCSAVTGDIGATVATGTARAVVWDARQDYPGFILTTGQIRIVADDEGITPFIAQLWRIDAGDTTTLDPAQPDTFAFGRPLTIGWLGTAPSIIGLDPALVAAADTVYPFDNGLLGYKYYLPSADCDSSFQDCWHPRLFNEATGDSISYFGPGNSLTFANDGSGSDAQHMLLPSGLFKFRVNTIDINALEIPDHRQTLGFVVNFDPETILLNGETDWAHPGDPEVYPYYLLLNDPLQIHHPFQGGDRIPDRTYVVFKALGRDDPRDVPQGGSHGLGLTGSMSGRRSNLLGGLFSFATNASAVNTNPAWAAGLDGWSADTLGFLTGPATEFTFQMQAVDEHDRRDGTPPHLSFDVGYPPCVQCVELLPRDDSVSAWDPDLACADDPATHPCFQDTTELRVTETGLGGSDLQFIQPVYMLVDKQNYAVRIADSADGQEQDNYIVNAKLFHYSVLLHSRDDAREAWADPLLRSLGWFYQIDYECDPFNTISDGGGNDSLLIPTWGPLSPGAALRIDPSSGLWRLTIDVVVPTDLFRGPDTFHLLLTYVQAAGDPEIGQAIFTATTKQSGSGTVRVVALDQTSCGFTPARPASYCYFKGVRPPLMEAPSGQTWRSCYLTVPDIKAELSLSDGAMRSHDGVPRTKAFHLVITTDTGDFSCVGQ